MSNQIIKIKPIDRYFTISWLIGTFCNYNCMYCPDEWHDSTSRPHDLDTLKTVWTNIYNKTKHLNLKYKISFTGGEVTANKSFLPLVKWMRENYDQDIGMLLVTTNGTASLQYYTNLAEYVDAISFSTHSEFMDEQKFFDKAVLLDKIMIRPEKSFHVNIMNEYWNKERIEQYKKYLTKHNISHSINEIDYTLKIREQILSEGVSNLETN